MSKKVSTNNSVVNFGKVGGSINNRVNINQDLAQTDLISILQKLKCILKDTSLQHLDKKELEIQITMLDAQTQSSKPNSNVIQECMRTVRSILESVTGNVVYAGLVSKINMFLW